MISTLWWGNPVISTRLCCSWTSCNFDIFEYFDVVFHNDQASIPLLPTYIMVIIVEFMWWRACQWVKSRMLSICLSLLRVKTLLEQACCISFNIYGFVFRRPCKVVTLWSFIISSTNLQKWRLVSCYPLYVIDSQPMRMWTAKESRSLPKSF